jgi:hypothetical protein
LEIFYDFGGYHIGVGKIGAVFERFVFEPEDVEVELVAFGYLFVTEAFESLAFFSLVAVSAVAAAL